MDRVAKWRPLGTSPSGAFVVENVTENGKTYWTGNRPFGNDGEEWSEIYYTLPHIVTHAEITEWQVNTWATEQP